MKMRWTLLVTLGLWFPAHIAFGAVIEGRVADYRTGTPLARARVLAMPVRSAGPQASVHSDARGEFRIEVPAGTYAVGAERPGYAFMWHGQTSWNGRGTPLAVEEGARVRVEIGLKRLGAINGVVRDENGVGLWEFPVAVFRAGKPLQPAGQVLTDDRGVFRVAGLTPGKYLVRTGYKQLAEDASFVPTFYGGAVAADSAQVVEVRLDEEAEGIEITPQSGRLLRLHGQVTFAGASVVRLHGDLSTVSAAVDGAGRFSFENVAPGLYYLTAEAKLPTQYMTAYQRIWLVADIDELKLEGAAAPLVQFRCKAEAEERTGAAAGLAMLIRIEPAGEARSEQIRCGGSATIPPGVWRIQASAAGDSYIETLSAQGRMLDTELVEVLPGERLELEAAISDKAGIVEGRVLDGSDGPVAQATVTLRAADPTSQRRLAARLAARTNTSGAFGIRGVPPGRYLAAVSWEGEDTEEIDWSNPRLRIVEVEAGQKTSINLRP